MYVGVKVQELGMQMNRRYCILIDVQIPHPSVTSYKHIWTNFNEAWCTLIPSCMVRNPPGGVVSPDVLASMAALKQRQQLYMEAVGSSGLE